MSSTAGRGAKGPPLRLPWSGDRPMLLLAPTSRRGWFGGRTLVGLGGGDVTGDATVQDVGAALESAFDGETPGVTAALITYEGHGVVLSFDRLLEWDGYAWQSIGERREAPGDGSEDWRHAAGLRAPVDDGAALLSPAEWDLSGREYRAAVRATRERIAAGDVYVLNLTARLTGRLTVTPAEAFERLSRRAGADMTAWLGGLRETPQWIASVSPERFLRVRRQATGERVVEVCPIKGTRARGATGADDEAAATALAADEKERAEHVMVVDLERNDLGVVCEAGSVRVDPLYEVVATPYCHQLVSSVSGSMRDNATIADLLAATFPCGSITGAPKRAAISIAAELEAAERGAYCGALLVAMEGEVDSSVLIRTLEDAGQGSARWGAGCGITFESDPVDEHLEMLLKASPVTSAKPALALRETMRVVDGRLPLLGRHLARLASGGCGADLLARVSAEALALASTAGVGAARLGVTVTPDGEVSAGLSREPSTLEVTGGPVLVPMAVEELPQLPQEAAKPASRMYWDRAHRAARMRGGHQAALVGPDGSLVDGSTSTIWLVTRGELSTPPAPPAVAGVSRELVFDLAAQLGLTAAERRIGIPELASAEEVFLSNAYGGVVAVRERGGAVTDAVSEAFELVMNAPRRPLSAG